MSAETQQTQPAGDDSAKKNIFAMTFEKKKQGMMELKKRNKRKGIAFFAVGTLILIPFTILFLYPQVMGYLNFSRDMQSYEKQVKDYEVTIADLNKTRDLHKAAYSEEFKTEENIMDKIFPVNPKKLEVIRLMEDFATELNTKNPPFEFTSISFSDPQKAKGYTVLPFQTTIHASQENFETFLGLIRLSGDYSAKNKDHIRLMEISNINLSYRGLDRDGVDQGVDFNVELNAYSR